MKKAFSNWNYKKHAKLVGAIYLTCFVIDMTFGYALVKKYVEKRDGAKVTD